jgi:hypothetical protein
MNRRTWIFLSFAFMFAICTVGWIEILFVDRCLDYGGAVENGACIGNSTAVPNFWEYLWPPNLLVLIPPAIFAAIVVRIVLFLAIPSNRNSLVGVSQRTPTVILIDHL